MKNLLLLFLFVLSAARVLTADLVISSFNQNGDLTWTNSLASNATYRVEWASSANGPWNKFDALTNLTLFSATSNSVTVKVPTFYRVVWLDPPAPEPEGTWDYKGYDRLGVLVVTGRLSLILQTNQVTGTWNFQRTGNPTSTDLGPQIGMGQLAGGFADYVLFLSLHPGDTEDVVLDGRIIGTNYTGRWRYESEFAGSEGTFVALKQPAGQ